jgi:poly(3-hydroxybutyrate) depolymerase
MAAAKSYTLGLQRGTVWRTWQIRSKSDRRAMAATEAIRREMAPGDVLWLWRGGHEIARYAIVRLGHPNPRRARRKNPETVKTTMTRTVTRTSEKVPKAPARPARPSKPTKKRKGK